MGGPGPILSIVILIINGSVPTFLWGYICGRIRKSIIGFPLLFLPYLIYFLLMPALLVGFSWQLYVFTVYGLFTFSIYSLIALIGYRFGLLYRCKAKVDKRMHANTLPRPPE